jgi:hypothetical protein
MFGLWNMVKRARTNWGAGKEFCSALVLAFRVKCWAIRLDSIENANRHSPALQPKSKNQSGAKFGGQDWRNVKHITGRVSKKASTELNYCNTEHALLFTSGHRWHPDPIPVA